MIIHPEADAELEYAAKYYNRRSIGLGSRFLKAVRVGYRQIALHPLTWGRMRGEVRRYLVKTFPYAIVYAHVDHTIYILAIMHVKREPTYWVGRLGLLPPS